MKCKEKIPPMASTARTSGARKPQTGQVARINSTMDSANKAVAVGITRGQYIGHADESVKPLKRDKYTVKYKKRTVFTPRQIATIWRSPLFALESVSAWKSTEKK
jgi:hypothetical protein